jgi:ankyrin repeat protein
MTAPLFSLDSVDKDKQIKSFMQTVQENDTLQPQFLYGVDINQKDTMGCSAMYWAVYHSNLENIKILLSNGSWLETVKGVNALFCAVYYSKIEVLDYFLEKGFDPIMEYKGLTLPVYAKKLKRKSIMKLLKRRKSFTPQS